MKSKKHSKHHGSATKSVPSKGGTGGNLKFPNPSQSIHVKQQKDKMAGNVGGSEAHMMPDKKAMGYQELELSGSGKKSGKSRMKY